LIRFAVMLTLVAVVIFGWYRTEFYSSPPERDGKVTVSFENVGKYEARASEAYRRDVLYVDFTQISAWLDMVSIGSVNSMRFVCTDKTAPTSAGTGGEEYAIFTNGSCTVMINGTALSLEAPCISVESHIWVPLSFVESYVSGIVCDRGTKGTEITIKPEGAMADSENTETDEEIKVNASFRIKAQPPLSHVEYPS